MSTAVREWVDRRTAPVPERLLSHAAFSRHLTEEPVSTEALLRAAEAEIVACNPDSARDREAAFSLLAADSYITYACLWTVRESADADDLIRSLEQITARIGHVEWRDQDGNDHARATTRQSAKSAMSKSSPSPTAAPVSNHPLG